MANKNSSNAGQEPMIKLQPNGTAPVLSYNVPEPTAYSGRNFIDLQLHDGYFLPTSAPKSLLGERQLAKSAAAASVSEPSSAELLLAKQRSGERMTTRFANLTPEEVERQEAEGRKLQIVKTMTGALSYVFTQASPVTAPALDAAPSMGEASLRSAGAPQGAETDGFVPTMLKIPTTEDPYPYPTDPEPEPEPVLLSVSIASPAPNAIVSGPYNGVPVEIRGSARVVSGGGDISSVQVQIDSGTFQTASLSGEEWYYQTVLKTAGTVAITAKARHSDSLKTTSSKISVTVQLAPQPDTVVPTVKIVTPSAGTLLSSKGGEQVNVTIEGIASDDRGLARVELSVDGTAPQLAESANGFANWKKTVTLTGGSHTVVANAVDAAGNTGTHSITLLVDTAPPTVNISSPANNAQISGPYSQGAVIEVAGTAADAGGIAYVELAIDLNPVGVRAAEKSPGDWSAWKGTLTLNEPGKHTITARAYDNAGNLVETTIAVDVTITPEVNSRLKRIILVESYRLSSYLANYGAGRTIKTFSLLPGEKSKISIRSYAQSESTMKSAATILDSVTDDISEEFEQSIAKEQADKKNYEESNEYKVGAEAGASWGWGSAKVSASMSGGTNAAREQFAKNVSNNTQKHVAKASARRDVQINTTYEDKSTTSEESTIVREIENINVSRTLTFVFRQMNQEFITLLHLVDVRIGYFTIDTVNGKEEKVYREVTLPQLDALLEETIVPDKRTEVRNAIIYQLTNIFDYQDKHHRFVEEQPFKDEDGNVIPSSNYLRVKKDYTSVYLDDSTGTTIKVPGIILAANRHVLRTDGIVVEALLGQGEALDSYSRNLQTESVREKELRNSLLEAEVEMKRLAVQILTDKDQAAAQIYALLNPAPVAQEDQDDAGTGSSSLVAAGSR
ncbi:Ig-like domain-containing protein [Cohnella sp. GbtcB17]|uniref:Ig-like domain-containing protein n=1 Tax=Cohnella sp. GbtcB17 TaxID=2824762 RepID=UPI001C310744|nr:Ig-like domain-containing protein [Cohnella sp. GbtcB17]